jgi:photosystem II stability/assembly factor-like uncharacterized protein
MLRSTIPSPTRAACLPAALLALLLIARPGASQQPNPFGELPLRSIGPAVMGGRIHDVQSLPDDPSTIWIASATGGLWKSTNRGTTWTPVFDGEPTGTFGVVAVGPSNHEVVWAGTGEQNNRQSSSWGDGVYRSSDGGRTWTHLGLANTRAIGRILVDPHNPDVALVGALGNLWEPSADRGVYRTTDGGRSWSKVLFVDTLTGIVDMARDGGDPNTVYAAAYQRLRQPWGFNGGGPGSGIYRSTDGGRTWRRLTQGLPTGEMGRIGLATSAHTRGLVYAVVEHATQGGIYRSTDGGDHWQRMSDQNSRPAYYSALYVDPTDDSRLYLLTRWFYTSEDAGKTWRTLPTEPTYDVGLKGDYHAMWIDPNDSRHFYLAGDGGLYQSWDRGATYVRIDNIPIGQFYGIGLDDRSPYWIYGGMQDDHSWEGPSATRHYLGITPGDWREIGFNDGLEQDVDVDGPRYVYSNAVEGDLTLVNAFTGDRREIPPVAAPGQPPLRWEWMTPGAASRVTPGTYYYGAQRLMITHDHGTTWTGTEDLTRHVDRDTLTIMGVKGSSSMLSKNDGQSAYSALSAVALSPVDESVIWVGSDDGNVQVSRDGGVTWTEVAGNMPGAPDGSYISRIAPSRAGPGVAYVAVDNHRRGDFKPYAYRTEDYGRTWTSIAAGLPPDGSVRFIGEHPDRAGVLFLGTEHALFVSPDRGSTWYHLGKDMPPTLYMEVQVQPRTHDAVVATHGRSLYILDDASSVAEWTPEVAREPAHLFPVRPAHIWQYWEDYSYRGQDFYAGENPPDGAILDYTLGHAVDSVTLTVADADGDVVRTLTGPGSGGVIHRVVWDLRHALAAPGRENPNSPQAHALPRPPRPLISGPWVSPGKYTVTLTAGGATSTRTVLVRPDPGMPALTEAEYRARERFLVDLLKVQRDAQDLLGRPNTPPAARRILFGASSLAGAFNGNGAVQGSLYPPTPEQQRRLDDLKAQLARMGGR